MRLFIAREALDPHLKIAAPVLALWAARGLLPAWYDVLAVWRDWADDVRGGPVEGGHFFAEEAPDATFAALRAFFTERAG